MKFSEHIGKALVVVMYALIGSWNISSAINSFIDSHYFMGAMNSMIALWMACDIIKTIFCW